MAFTKNIGFNSNNKKMLHRPMRPPHLDEELQKINDYWEREDQSPQGMRPWMVIQYQVITPKSIQTRNTEHNQQVVCFQTRTHIPIIIKRKHHMKNSNPSLLSVSADQHCSWAPGSSLATLRCHGGGSLSTLKLERRDWPPSTSVFVKLNLRLWRKPTKEQ